MPRPHLPLRRALWTLVAILLGLAYSACSTQTPESTVAAAGAATTPSPLERLDVAFGSNSYQRLDIFYPPSVTNIPALPQPAILHIHGGGWTKGDKSMLAEASRRLAREEGYVVIAVNYRLAKVRQGENLWPACWDDASLALAWVLAHAKELHIDPTRIAAAGYSAGGHLAALLGTRPETREKITCVVDFFGPANLRPEGNQPGRKLLFGRGKRTDAIYAEASPIDQVSKDAAPFIILHGESDRMVPITESRTLYRRLQEEGVEAEMYTYPKQKHAFNRPDDKGIVTPEGLDAMEKARTFLKKHLRP